MQRESGERRRMRRKERLNTRNNNVYKNDNNYENIVTLIMKVIVQRDTV